MTTEGWICPTCKRGVSPYEATCDHGGMAAHPHPLMPFAPIPRPSTMDRYRLGKLSQHDNSTPYICDTCRRTGGPCGCTLSGYQITC